MGLVVQDTKLIKDFSEQIGLPVIVIAANWNQERAVDLEDQAARVFYDVLEATLAAAPSGESLSEVALVLIGRGGQCSFADAVRRALGGLKISYRVYIPCPVDAAMTLLSLGASQIYLHPFGGIGALDSSPQQQQAAEASILLAGRMLQMSGHTLDGRRIDQLQTSKMGQGTFLGESDLARLGLKARTVTGDERSNLWELFKAIETRIGLSESGLQRFTPSETWPDEVEFEPATMLTAALIASDHRQATFELDTGRPDPDKASLQGAWQYRIP